MEPSDYRSADGSSSDSLSLAASPRPHAGASTTGRPTSYSRRKIVRRPPGTSSYRADMAGLISQGLALLQPVVKGRRVLLKPNLVEYEAGTIINTHPAVIAARLRPSEGRVPGNSRGEGPGIVAIRIPACGQRLADYLRELRTRTST